MKERRGILITPDGERHEVPEYLLDEERIAWPPGLDEVSSGRPPRILKPSDFYVRHEVAEDQFYVFAKEHVSLEDVPPDVISALLSGGSLEDD